MHLILRNIPSKEHTTIYWM